MSELQKQRGGEHPDKMTVLPEERCHLVKDTADPLLFVSLTNQHTLSGEMIGNGLVLALVEQERSRD